MNDKNIHYLIQALYNDEMDSDPASAGVYSSKRRYNWLDDAPTDRVLEIADDALLTCARLMVIRAAAMREEAFNRNGFCGIQALGPDPIPQEVLLEAEEHDRFYLELRTRLSAIEHLESINRRGHIIRFPGSAPSEDLEKAGGTEPSLHDQYEDRRRANIASENTPIIPGPGTSSRSFLDTATARQLEESTEIIMLASAARMAVRSSLRLEKAWRRENIYFAGLKLVPPPFSGMLEERNYYVSTYLITRENLAKATHKIGIAQRSVDSAIRKPRRPRMRLKKQASA